MLETAQIKHANAAILAAANKHINTIGAETNVVDFLIVSDELRLGCKRGYVPYGACSVYARRDYQTWRDSVPVERG